MAKEFDLVVRGGMVADGSGAEPIEADVAIKDGLVAEVGRVHGRGTEEISAKGMLVTPGFVDIHTHYDGQITWADRLAPSSNHGVTTVVMSNCGVGFAPCSPKDRDLLIRLMEGIEDIPAPVMAAGIPWQWESFPQYLDFLDTRPCDMDFATQVPHAPVRVNVMGQRAADREPATDDDLARMTKIVQEAVIAGALGFTTSRTMNHRTRAGALAPTVTAAEEELRAIALGLKSIGRGVLQFVDDFNATSSLGSAEFEMWQRVAAASGRPMSFSVFQDKKAPLRYREILEMIVKANKVGPPSSRIRGQVSARPVGNLFGLDLSSNPFSNCPTYQGIAHLPLAARVPEMRRPEFRARLLKEEPVGVVGRETRNRNDLANMYELGEPPVYGPDPVDSIGARAAQKGITPLEYAYDLLVQGDGGTLIYYPSANFAERTLEPLFEMLTHPDTVISLGDGGAHVARICDASMPTFLLTYWTRDRKGERLPVGKTIQMLCSDTADTVGLGDRGRLARGYVGDLNIIDFDRLQLHAPRPAFDLPTGAVCLSQKANGYVATVKNGAVTYREGKPTTALPGRLLRGARPAPPTH